MKQKTAIVDDDQLSVGDEVEPGIFDMLDLLMVKHPKFMEDMKKMEVRPRSHLDNRLDFPLTYTKNLSPSDYICSPLIQQICTSQLCHMTHARYRDVNSHLQASTRVDSSHADNRLSPAALMNANPCACTLVKIEAVAYPIIKKDTLLLETMSISTENKSDNYDNTWRSPEASSIRNRDLAQSNYTDSVASSNGITEMLKLVYQSYEPVPGKNYSDE